MKPTILLASLALAATSVYATAATDRSYYVTELEAQQRFDVYNDGHNTYLESIPGLVMTGATADGERFIVNGVPPQIRGFMNGKPITVVCGTAPVPKPTAPDATAVTAQIKQLTEKLDSLSAKVQPKTPQTVALASAGTTQPQTAPMAPSAVPTSYRAGNKNAQLPSAAGFISVAERMTWNVSPRDQNLRLLIER